MIQTAGRKLVYCDPSQVLHRIVGLNPDLCCHGSPRVLPDAAPSGFSEAADL